VPQKPITIVNRCIKPV